MLNHMDYKSRCLGYRDYNQYLAGEYWKTFVRSLGKKPCFCCGRKETQYHHITYERFGKESPQDVVAVCGSCHVAIHRLVRGGKPLKDAHLIHRRKVSPQDRAAARDEQWVHRFRLLNKSKRQTVAELQSFLEEKGLVSGGSPTEAAFRLGFARLIDGKEKWNVSKYIPMMQADKKLRKLRSQGKPIHPSLCRQALANSATERALRSDHDDWQWFDRSWEDTP